MKEVNLKTPLTLQSLHVLYMYIVHVAQEIYFFKNSKKHTEGMYHLLFHSACRS